MSRLLSLLVLGISLCLIQGCAPNDVYYKKSRGKWVTKKSYSLADTLVVKDYALYNSRAKVSLSPEKGPFEVDKDSLLTVLLSSFKRLGLENIKTEIGSNVIDSTLYRTQGVRVRHFDDSYINKIAGDTHNCPALVLITYAHNQFAFTGFISSGGMAGSSGYTILTWLSLFVFVVDQNEIVYSRHILYKSDQVWADTEEEILAVPPLAAVRQEHWDELVRLAMKDYIKRMK
ncbi:hypothetical protein MMU07_04565 [Aquiflexum sp. LQ15W]|uniref:hypothetical protein n=1 Tax=Cognataquiflexum nitidum TaxID=2922272 RepID=UPI001F134010|nr:hypothetical protein [Cognataquiflexum nitidum]MCH6198837.1 hypothetical protein [Cognataquiflexum nitidum]